jgi:PPOX class probable F420-dependent enzyme
MRRDLTIDHLGDLVELLLLAVLATYRQDGTVLLSPVWHEWRDGGFNIVTGSRGVKATHLLRDPRASIVVCEHSPPYRGVELRCRAQLVTAGVEDAVKRIASRYLGREAGAAYAERTGDDLLIRLEPGDLRAWDLADEFSRGAARAASGDRSTDRGGNRW